MNEISERLGRLGKVRVNEFMLRALVSDNDREYELTLFSDGRAIVKGTGNASEARGIYAKFIGH